MDKNGLLLFAKFAYPVSHQCGCNAKEQKEIWEFIEKGRPSLKLLKTFQKFRNASFFLKKIAEKNHLKDPFCFKSV